MSPVVAAVAAQTGSRQVVAWHPRMLGADWTAELAAAGLTVESMPPGAGAAGELWLGPGMARGYARGGYPRMTTGVPSGTLRISTCRSASAARRQPHCSSMTAGQAAAYASALRRALAVT
ncbi:MAG: hypothetical protein ABR562_09935 [Thermoplasmatota archaeon]